jgi:hypothetical protein
MTEENNKHFSEIVKKAMTETVTDIGQLSKQETKDLEYFVRKGVLIKGKGGCFPKVKTVYAIKGYDIVGERKKALNKL